MCCRVSLTYRTKSYALGSSVFGSPEWVAFFFGQHLAADVWRINYIFDRGRFKDTLYIYDKPELIDNKKSPPSLLNQEAAKPAASFLIFFLRILF